jgi:hypothetical protein
VGVSPARVAPSLLRVGSDDQVWPLKLSPPVTTPLSSARALNSRYFASPSPDVYRKLPPAEGPTVWAVVAIGVAQTNRDSAKIEVRNMLVIV